MGLSRTEDRGRPTEYQAGSGTILLLLFLLDVRCGGELDVLGGLRFLRREILDFDVAPTHLERASVTHSVDLKPNETALRPRMRLLLSSVSVSLDGPFKIWLALAMSPSLTGTRDSLPILAGPHLFNRLSVSASFWGGCGNSRPSHMRGICWMWRCGYGISLWHNRSASVILARSGSDCADSAFYDTP